MILYFFYSILQMCWKTKRSLASICDKLFTSAWGGVRGFFSLVCDLRKGIAWSLWSQLWTMNVINSQITASEILTEADKPTLKQNLGLPEIRCSFTEWRRNKIQLLSNVASFRSPIQCKWDSLDFPGKKAFFILNFSFITLRTRPLLTPSL